MATPNKSLLEYQKQIDTMLQAYEKPYWHPLSQLARMIEEVGEVSRILNHKYGDKPKKLSEEHQDLADELADILYTTICLANSQNIKLDPALEKAIAKLETRDKGRFKKK
ncbi:nucleotide pyrophosphohydrolase [Candidatus Saccharibacteria bacterium]|nr:nucleotide pyrophosphohydrolase [Candidatus Saccharibacteria bacterium]